MVDYTKLWILLATKHINKTQLRIGASFNTSTLAKLGKNQLVSLDVLVRICRFLNCDFKDIIEYKEAL